MTLIFYLDFSIDSYQLLQEEQVCAANDYRDAKAEEESKEKELEKFIDLHQDVNTVDELEKLEGFINILVQIEPGEFVKEEFVQKLNKKEVEFKLNYKYENIFNGFSIEVKASELKKVFDISGIESIYPVGEVMAKSYNTYPQFEIEKARELRHGRGLRGQGITVAILDTGVDFYHQDLGSGFGPGNKVVGGYDMINDRYYPMDDDGHGTHVAGIIAANGKKEGLVPEAKIVAYKVLDDQGKGRADNVLAAIEEIIKDSRNNEEYAADVINMSFGTTEEFVGELISNAMETAVKEGIMVVAAAGNSGPGEKTLDFPNYSEDIITAGASGYGSNQVKISASNFSGDITGEKMLFSPGVDFDGPKELVYVGDGSYRRDYMDWTGDTKVEGKVALARKGSSTYREKAELAEEEGAKALIVFDGDSSDMLYGSLVNPGEHIPTYGITGSRGWQLVDVVSSREVKVSFDTYSKIPDFSSRGPSELNTLKPDVVAPGSRVMSTWVYGNYSWAEGTSVSAAFVSGTAALLKQKYPDYSPEEIKSVIMNTASPLTEGGERYPLIVQGAGEIRPYDALSTDTVVSQGSLSITGADISQGEYAENKTITVKNTSSMSKRYNVSIKYKNEKDYLQVAPEEESIRVSRNSEKDLEINFELKDELPVDSYTGYVILEDMTTYNKIRVPFYIENKLEQNHNLVDINVDPFAVSDILNGIIELEFFKPVERVNVVLKDSEGNSKKHIYNNNFGEQGYVGELTIPWEEVAGLSTGSYFVYVNVLPEGKSAHESSNWVDSTQKVVVDKDIPGIDLKDGLQGKIVDDSTYYLEGEITDYSTDYYGEEVNLTINGEEVNVDSDGKFSYKVELTPGENKIKFSVVDWVQNRKEISKSIIYQPEKVGLHVGSNRVNDELSPIIINERALIPLELFEKELGCRVHRYEDNNKVEIIDGFKTIELFPGQKEVLINDQKHEVQISPRIKAKRVYVPVSLAARGLNHQVEWNSEARNLKINKSVARAFIGDISVPFKNQQDMFMDRMVLRVVFPASYALGWNYYLPRDSFLLGMSNNTPFQPMSMVSKIYSYKQDSFY